MNKKIFTFLAAALFILGFTSCGDDDGKYVSRIPQISDIVFQTWDAKAEKWVDINADQFTSKMSHEIVNITKAMHNLDISLQKSFLKDNALTFNLSWTDILNRNIQHVECDFGPYTDIQTFDYKNPGIVLRASYRFNSAQSKYKGTGAGQSVKDRM